MSTAEYGQSDLGVSGEMVSGYGDLELLVQVGKYYLPNSSGIGESGLMVSGLEAQGVALRTLDNYESFKIEDTGLTEIPTATFQIVCAPEDAPVEGSPVVIAVGTLAERLFGGYLDAPEAEDLTPDLVRYTCTARGWMRDLEKRLVSGHWENHYAGEIVRDLFTIYLPQFRYGAYVSTGTLIADYQVEDTSIQDICNDLADRCGYIFYLDPLREAHFCLSQVLPAPWNITSSVRWGKLKVKTDTTNLVNRVIVLFSELRSQSEQFVGDGSTKNFTLAYTPYVVSSLTVNGVDVTYATKYATDNSANDFSIDYTQGLITTSAHDTLTSADTLAMTYTAKYPAKLIRVCQASVDDRQDKEGGDGYYDLKIADRDIISLADARTRADAELSQYAWPQVSASYVRAEEIGNIFAQRLQVGMQQRLQYREYDELLSIERVTITILRPGADELVFLQTVQLGPQPSTLSDVLKSVTSDDSTSDTADIVYEEVYNA